jgi:hypothetical protein
MSADIPTQSDFQLGPERGQDLDAWHAWDTFGGRTLDEAYATFRENALGYQEDLMWMAPKPFCFYLPVVLRYVQSEESCGDSDIVNCLASNIEFHFQRGHDITAAFACIQAICDYVLSQYSKFDVNEEIYGDLRPPYENLKRKIGERGAAPNGGPATPPLRPGVSEGRRR